MVVGVLTHCALLQFVSDLKATQGYNAAETTKKNICCMKGESTVDYSTVTR